MGNKNLIWLGLGAVALYFFLRKKNKPTSIFDNNSTKSNTKKVLPNGIVLDPNPYFDKTCDELRTMRLNDALSRIAPPTDSQGLIKWELDNKYKNIAYVKCRLDAEPIVFTPPPVSVSEEARKLESINPLVIDPLLNLP